MLRRSALLGAAALALPLTALVAPTGASAAEERVSRVVLQDPSGDVWVFPGDSPEPVPAGDEPTADVIRAVVRHGRGNVVVRMTFTDLRRDDAQVYSATIFRRGHQDSVSVSTGPGHWHGNDLLVRLTSHFSKVSCPRLIHRVDYDTEQVSIWVPRNCIGRPDWVKVGLGNSLVRGESEFDQETFLDNPHSTTADWAATPRLYSAAN